MLTIDGREYKVHIIRPSLKNSFTIMEGDNAGIAQSGREIRDIIGTAYSYQLEVEPNPLYPEDFDALFETLSAPVESHLVSLPYGQSSLEFYAAVSEGERTWYGKSLGFERWKHMSISFRPIAPQRTEA